ncbi:1362_t:CDS:10 [Funneliformis caledonium]|uniref:1362_t:CDS:1 n=1 Tax=Funneliformis caledonium TaxID=1117310 RepID=A0A9N9BXY8_9GLOM|nr:1362_t:CDS:10 [Funneliformis caledonium]
MNTEQRKVSRKDRQDGDINFFLKSTASTPISFFRLTHPTQRIRAINKYKKCLAIAINRSNGSMLDKLKALDTNEEFIQRDWETWLKEKKAVLACRTRHDTNLQIQQDFALTMKTIFGATKNDIGEHNYIVSEKRQLEDTESEELSHKFSVPKKIKSETSNIDEVHKEIDGRTARSSNKLYPELNSFNNIFLQTPSELTYLPESKDSRDDTEPEQKETIQFQYDWFVGLGIKESTLSEFDNKWTIGTINISNLLLEYRNLSVKKASENKLENAVEMLSLDHIFLLDENLSIGISEMTANENFQGCKSLLRKWQKEVEENNDDLILEVFESMSSDVLDPSTYKNSPFQGRRADFSIYTQIQSNKYYLLVSEIKPTRYMSSKETNFVDFDLIKIGNEMKNMLDKCIKNGVKTKDLSICSILVEGFQCSVFVMDLKFDAIYRMILLGKFFLPQNVHNLNVLSIAIEELMQIKQINNLFTILAKRKELKSAFSKFETYLRCKWLRCD